MTDSATQSASVPPSENLPWVRNYTYWSLSARSDPKPRLFNLQNLCNVSSARISVIKWAFLLHSADPMSKESKT